VLGSEGRTNENETTGEKRPWRETPWPNPYSQGEDERERREAVDLDRGTQIARRRGGEKELKLDLGGLLRLAAGESLDKRTASAQWS